MLIYINVVLSVYRAYINEKKKIKFISKLTVHHR